MGETASVESLESRLFLHGDPALEPAEATPFHLRLDAGGPTFVDSAGNTWERDRMARGGKNVRRVYDVGGTAEDPLFATHRAGKFIRYAIPLPAPGTYGLNLLFADPKFTAPGQRLFDVFAEDQPLLTGFDLAASGGDRSAVVRSFGVTSWDGVLNLGFRATLGKVVVSAVEVYQGDGVPPVTSAWELAAPAPVPLFEAQGAAVGDRVFIFGGFHNESVQATRAVSVYDAVANTWTPRADMPAAVTHAGVVADGATIWLVGGLVGDYNGGVNPTTADVWKYDTAADAWAPGPALPSPSGAGGLAVVGRRLHYFGGLGADGQNDSDQHWTLDLDNPAAQWTTAASLPVARNHFGTAVVDGKIYAIGGQHGRDETNGNLRDVHVYNPANNRWSAATRLPKAMSHFHPSTVAVNGHVLIAGGVTNGRTALSEVWDYDPATRRWSPAAPLPAPRKAPVMVFAAGRLLLVAGSPGDNFPQTTTWFHAL